MSCEHHHHHSSAVPATMTRLLLTMALNFIITIAEIIGGLLSGSLSLISDALHNFSDGISVIISYIALKLKERDYSAKHTFGLKRAEIFAAVINSAVLVGISVYLFYEAIQRLITPQTVAGGLMTAVAVIGLVANVAGTLLLRKDAQLSMNIKSAYLHLLSDAISSVGVILGGLAIYFWNIYWIDPVLTILIGVYIIRESFQILSQALHILMEGAPPHISFEKIQLAVEALPGVQNLHHVHVWTVGESDVHFEGHVNVNDMLVSESHALRKAIAKLLRQRFGVTHATLQFECNQCLEVGLVNNRESPSL